MKLTTQLPSLNVLDVLPELRSSVTTTVRLHPRSGTVNNVSASKFAGTFLWPDDQDWLRCFDSGPPDWWFDQPDPPEWWGNEPWLKPEDKHSLLVPVLQLHAPDVPELEFFPGTDLFQLFWCPLDHRSPVYFAKPVVVWRNTHAVSHPLKQMPIPPLAHSAYLLQPCRLTLERVIEDPPFDELTAEQQQRLATWNIDPFLDELQDSPETLYEWSLSVCPSMKLGGYVAWVQRPEYPTCTCGHVMTHLLTIPDMEWDGGTYQRWMPMKERHLWDGPPEERLAVQSATGIGLGGGKLYVFICRVCPTWPIRTIFQR